ncbi:MAG TPA: 16S rRNA (cytosine(1402)-N(4))-methyltransferase RsmH [Candidatus Paceibacterota bacterium]
MTEITHIPVLAQEVLEYLNPQQGDIVFDGTLGGGGHARLILPRIGLTGQYIATDLDAESSNRVAASLPEWSNLHVHTTSFKNIGDVLSQEGIHHANVILADLGWNSDQFKQDDRGFSFVSSALDMRYHKGDGISASDIINEWSEDTLVTLFNAYGEEPNAKKIARTIRERRATKPFTSGKELADFIESVIPRRGKKIHPATKVFQALRITVNNELGDLQEFLANMLTVSTKGTRIGIITFHSLEDRIVKHYFRDLIKDGTAMDINYGGATATDEELLANPRSRSARLRVIEIL